MDNGPVTQTTRSFYQTKSIQRTYNYHIYFENSSLSNLIDNNAWNFNNSHYYATSIEVPNYEFKDEEYRIGSFVKTFPVLEHHGFAFTIKFEEDDQGTIQSLIDKLTRKNIKSSGYYNTYANTVIDQIQVSVFRPNGTNIYKRNFFNCYFLKSSTPTYSYNNSEKIEYDITFKADHFETTYGTAHFDEDYNAPED